MSYAQGNLIEATDYYTLAAAGSPYTGQYIGQHWGTGTAEHGMGQNMSAISHPPNNVSTGNVITAVQWTGLIQTINNCLAHQGHAPVSPLTVVAGNPASYYSSITVGSALAYASAGATGLALSDSSAFTSTFSGSWGATGGQTLETIHTVTFSSANAARYFFNSGGKIKLAFSRSGGSATPRNLDWSNLCADAGVVQIGYKNTDRAGGTGTYYATNTSNGGYWNLATSYVNQFRQFSGGGYGGYGAGLISVDASWSGSLSNGGYPVLLVRTVMDDAVSLSSVDGTTSVSLVVSSPATTYLANTWGSPAVSSTVSAI